MLLVLIEMENEAIAGLVMALTGVVVVILVEDSLGLDYI